jgi:hypothetical protein
MPNHVHLILALRGHHSCAPQADRPFLAGPWALELICLSVCDAAAGNLCFAHEVSIVQP